MKEASHFDGVESIGADVKLRYNRSEIHKLPRRKMIQLSVLFIAQNASRDEEFHDH